MTYDIANFGHRYDLDALNAWVLSKSKSNPKPPPPRRDNRAGRKKRVYADRLTLREQQRYKGPPPPYQSGILAWLREVGHGTAAEYRHQHGVAENVAFKQFRHLWIRGAIDYAPVKRPKRKDKVYTIARSRD